MKVLYCDEAALDPGNTSTFITTGTGETGEGESVGGRTVMALLEDGAGANIGYKFLTVYNFADFRFSLPLMIMTMLHPPLLTVNVRFSGQRSRRRTMLGGTLHHSG